MNLTKKKQKEIRELIVKKIPEVKKALQIKKEIIQILVDGALKRLNKYEKYLIKNYPEVIRFQYNTEKYYEKNKHNSIHISGEDSEKSLIKPKYKRTRRYYWENNNDYCSDEVFDLSEIYYEDFKEITQNIPFTYNFNLSNIDFIFSNEELSVLIEKIDSFNSYLVIAEKKLQKLNTILTSNLINLNDLKKNCPGLYKIIKYGE